MTTFICGQGSRCERHDVALHGYPCYGCQLEWQRRSPRVRALIRQQASPDGALVTPAEMAKARAEDAAATYDGPHDVTVEKAGPSGPVARLWNAVCVEECGWSHYWLKSKRQAQDMADEHQAS